ncbi:conserved hypothetical protein [Vibrio nigripulchritudo MADA3029]|uniref:hypothetical protein n=1 Tax=Vibrio nigripulchritudo TaxID=28173 RepID=UPI0003B23B6E|nr:hypothetical protein [Vibrio nigripulchritudo]CCN48941.1 conserved hypothetical protein [Vibrio nigripulchritudo MADA3020]CCN53227.1 conserved hypothetical protein [Vibrio nigripulchritudo MADA3021]CCN56829.1 conserved hypothetical protein [Vibrio nigripulchritudo MADA3029]
MSIKQTLHPRQRVQFQAVGEFMYVANCPSEILIETHRGNYRLSRGAQILDEKLGGLVTVENLGESGEVEIIVGMGRYVPPADGQEVVVGQMPPVALAPNQTVEVNKLPMIQLADGQQVVIASMPAVSFADGQQFNVATLPQVEFAPGQKVGMAGDVMVRTKQTFTVRQRTSSSYATGKHALPYTIPAKKRGRIMVKAPKANTGAIHLGDFELDAGESIELFVESAIAVTGAATDHVQFLEY